VNFRRLSLFFAALVPALALVAQDPAQPTPGDPTQPVTTPPVVLPPSESIPATGDRPAVIGPTPTPTPFPQLPALSTRPARTNLPNASTNRASAVPRGFPTRPAAATAPAATTLPGVVRPGQTGPLNPNVRPGAQPPTAPGQASEEDKKGNEDALEAAKQFAETGSARAPFTQAVKNMPMDQFLDMYSFYAGRIILRAQSLPQLQVTLIPNPNIELSRDEVMQMFDTVLALNGITMIATGDKFITAVPAQQANQEAAAFSDRDPSEYPEASQYTTHIIQLKHVDIQEAAQTLTQFQKNPQAITVLASTRTLILRDYAINVKRMLEVLERIDIEVEEDFVLEVIPIKFGKVDEIYATLTSVIGGGGGVVGAPGGGVAGAAGGSGISGARRGGTGGVGGGQFGNQFGGNQFNQGANQGVGGVNNRNRFGQQQAGLQAGAAGTVNNISGGSFQNRLNNLSRGGPGGSYGSLADLLQTVSITADQRSNSLIVYGNRKDIAKLREVLQKVDTLLPQVLIEAIIMEVNLADGYNYGISAAQRTAQLGQNNNNRGGGAINNTGQLSTGSQLLQSLGRGVGTNNLASTAAGGLTYFAQVGQNWDLALTALANDSRVNVIQRPRVITSHATPGSFFVGNEVPFVSGSFFGGGTFGNSQQITRQQVGVTLDVTPFITPDGLVVMDIFQTVDNLGASVDVGNGLSVPSTQQRNAHSFVTVRDKDAVLLGGYITTSTSRSRNGVPLLKDVPLLGNLFSSRTQNNNRTELMILVRPSILPTPADAAKVADLERQRLPGVRVAEKEFEQTEEAERRKADRMMDAKSKKSGATKRSPSKAPPALNTPGPSIPGSPAGY
jgi:general secretion pathway protein D